MSDVKHYRFKASRVGWRPALALASLALWTACWLAIQWRQLASFFEHTVFDANGGISGAGRLRPLSNPARGFVIAVGVVASALDRAPWFVGLDGDGDAPYWADDRARGNWTACCNSSRGWCNIGADGRDSTRDGGNMGRGCHHGRVGSVGGALACALLGDAASASETAHTAKGP